MDLSGYNSLIKKGKKRTLLNSHKHTVAFILLLFISLLTNAKSNGNSIELAKSSNEIEVTGVFEYIEAVDGFSVRSIQTENDLLSLKNSQWLSLTEDTINLGFINTPHWFKFNITNNQDEKLSYFLVVNYPVIDYIDIYIESSLNDNVEKHKTGDLRPFNSRPVENRNFVVELNFQPKESKTIYYFIETQGALQAPTNLIDKATFSSGEQIFLVAEGAYFGIMSAMFIYFGVVYLFIREKVYLFFSLTILHYTVFQLSMVGLGFQYLWGGFPEINRWVTPFTLSMFSFWAGFFMIEFLRLKETERFFYFSLLSLVIVSLIVGVLSLFVSYYLATIAATFLAVPLALLAIVISVYKVFKEKKSIKVFLGAWLFFTALAVVISLEKFGLFPQTVILEHGLQVGSLMAALLLALAIAERVRNDKFDKENAFAKVRLSEKKEQEIRLRNQALQLEALKNSQDARQKVMLAEAKSEAKSNFLAIMSHEIRTPMSGVLGGAKLLKESSLEGEQKEYLEMIESSGKALMSIINDILDYSKIEAGKMDIVPSEFELKTFCKECLASFQWLSKDKNLRLLDNLDQIDELKVYTDANRLRQILLNLLNNAFKFTKEGEVRFFISQSPPEELKLNITEPVIYFEISDTGIGIEQSQLHQLFEVFTQADSSTTREFGGSGLGLSICKRLALLLGGDIGAVSELGKGSKFWFTIAHRISSGDIDSIEVSDSAELNFENEELAKQKLAGKFALIAEDNPVNQVVISKIMEKLAIDFELVGDGQQALDKIRNDHQKYDIVLMDCEMPVLDGYQTSRAIRQWEEESSLNQIPIVAITAHALDEHREKTKQAGMNGHISKPIDRSKLFIKLASLLD